MQRDKVSEKVVWENYNPDNDLTSVSNVVLNQQQVMLCYNCNKVIPDNSKFCPWCQIELYTECPQCGNKYSSQYPACNQCGTDRRRFIDRDNQLINLTPYKKENQEFVHSGYRDGVCTHIHLHELSRIGEGIDARYLYKGVNAADIGIIAHLYNGNCWFDSWFCREDIHNGRLEYLTYHKKINDPYFHMIELTKGLKFKKIKNFWGKVVDYEFTPYMSAEHSLTDLARKELNLNCWNQIIEIREWMERYSHYLWQDIKDNYELLQGFLGMSPYVFFEYDKYYEYDKK